MTIQSFAQALTIECDSFTPCMRSGDDILGAQTLARMHLLIEKILRTAALKFSQPQFAKVVLALTFTARCYTGRRRDDKRTPYLMHLLEVLNIILEMQVFDYKIFIAAILHDVVEDGKSTQKEVRRLFGAPISMIVKLLDKRPYKDNKRGYYLRVKKERDINCLWRVLVIRYADRTHNMMTLYLVSTERQEKKLRETNEEFPALYETLKQTIKKLRTKGTLRNKTYLSLADRMQKRLWYEMDRYG